MHPALRPVTPADLPSVRAFLSENPYENVLLDWLLSHGVNGVREPVLCARSGVEGAVAGCVYFGRQTVLAASGAPALECIARSAPRNLREAMIIAPRAVARQYWDSIKGWHAAPRLVRDSQPVFALSAQHVPAGRPDVITRLALAGEADAVAHHSAAMIEHELGYNPLRADGAFGANVRRMIARGMWWVGLSDGKPAFFAHTGPHSAQTVQLQGVWTVPERRRAGIASGALTNISRELLRVYPSVSLYVNDFNTPAISLYERLGFRRCGTLATYLF